MTTPNTLKATLTSDVGEAQVAIQRLTKTVEDMGRTVNATSAAGQKAFKAEADEVARLLVQLGASEKQMTRLEQAKSSFAARVKSESAQAVAQAGQMASAYGGAAKDVVKGLTDIAASSKVTVGGLKDILSGVGSLAFAFGPAGAFVSAVAIGTSAVVGLFTSAREEMAKTQQEFADRLAAMQKSANAEGLRNEAKRIFDEMAPLKARLAQAQQNDFGGLTVGEGLRARRVLPGQIAGLESQFAAAREAALNPIEDVARSGMNRVTVTANGPGFKAKDPRTGSTLSASDAASPAALALEQAKAIEEVMLTMRRQATDSPLAMIAADVTKPITALQALRAELAGTADDFRMMADTARFSLEQGIGAGLDALISGRGNVIRELKRAAAEPIVAELRMNAIKSLGQAASYAASFNFAAVPAALAAAAKNTLGAVAVARLGGLAGGGGTDGISAGGTGGGGVPRSASLPGDGLSAARSDRPVRIEMILVQQTPDGRELARQRQVVQRLDDRNQPIRVVL